MERDGEEGDAERAGYPLLKEKKAETRGLKVFVLDLVNAEVKEENPKLTKKGSKMILCKGTLLTWG